MRQRTLTALFTAIAMLAATATPMFAADNGTVDATVTLATPCVTMDTTSIGFGTQVFSTPGNEVIATGNPQVGITNCGAADEVLYGAGTDAASADPNNPAQWALVTQAIDCGNNTPNDSYALEVLNANIDALLSTSASTLITLPGNAGSLTIDHLIHMPCSGSTGAGQTMSMQVIYTVTF